MIKVVCFDLDGVYFINGKKKFLANLVERGVAEEKARSVFLESDKMNKEYKAGLIEDEEYWQWALKEWNLKMSPKGIVDLLLSGYEVNLPAAQLVKKLRLENYQTATCSNNFPARIEGLNQRFGFLEDFDIAIFSYEVGVLKPAQMIFKELIARSGVGPEEIVYSDDDPEKIKGATDLGIKTFVYQDFEQYCRVLRKLKVNID
ncbi:MAG TPA: HAD-IA family hydrolase [Candidatus Bathyarchaeia archaeon]|nr:HAD-IA family hydrolase [Candidatus Bathyarchaeia archaeon]